MKKKMPLITYFAVTEHCGRKIMVDEDSLNECTEISCPGCDEPVMFRSENGLWYSSAGRVFL